VPAQRTPSWPVLRLKRRPEFLAVAATGQRWVAPAFVLQVGPRSADGAESPAAVGLGFTASRRIGKAVARNRARRRLVAAARSVVPAAATPGYNYVIVARAAVLTCPFPQLLEDLATAFRRVLQPRKRRPAPAGRSPAAS
jgi:ribonuclease P protein component